MARCVPCAPILHSYGPQIAILGKGSHGEVYLHTKGSETVAIKRCHNNEDGVNPSLVREVYYLSLLQWNDVRSIIALKNVIITPSYSYLILERGETDLSQVTNLSLQQKEEIVLQLLNAVGTIHRHNLLHRDIKPSNILINGVTRSDPIRGMGGGMVYGPVQVRLIDLGFMSPVDIIPQEEVLYTLQYRPPELAIGRNLRDGSYHHSYPADIWALGCTIYELFMGGRLLFPVRTSYELLLSIFYLFGTPDDGLSWRDLKQYQETQSRPIPHYEPKPDLLRKRLEQRRVIPSVIIDLIMSMLTLDERQRYSLRMMERVGGSDLSRNKASQTEQSAAVIPLTQSGNAVMSDVDDDSQQSINLQTDPSSKSTENHLEQIDQMTDDEEKRTNLPTDRSTENYLEQTDQMTDDEQSFESSNPLLSPLLGRRSVLIGVEQREKVTRWFYNTAEGVNKIASDGLLLLEAFYDEIATMETINSVSTPLSVSSSTSDAPSFYAPIFYVACYIVAAKINHDAIPCEDWMTEKIEPKKEKVYEYEREIVTRLARLFQQRSSINKKDDQ